MSVPKINWSDPSIAGLYTRPEPEPLSARKRYVRSPHANEHTVPRIPGKPSIKECRANNICIHCRVNPCMYHGPDIGYSARCDACTTVRAARGLGRGTHG